LPFQGDRLAYNIPRAMPWARSFCPFRACGTRSFHPFRVCGTGNFHSFRACGTGNFHPFRGVWDWELPFFQDERKCSAKMLTSSLFFCKTPYLTLNRLKDLKN